MNHPSLQDIEHFVIGAFDAITFGDIEAHFSGCEQCSAELRQEAKLEESLFELAEAGEETCSGCGRAKDKDRCEHCGAAHAPGGFVVERLLVQTATGRVYVARDPSSQRRVALKELVFTRVPDMKTIVGFEREAKILKQLRHPGIPRFVASFQEGEGVHTRLYLAQEYIEGDSLDVRMKSRRFSEDDVIDAADQVLDILEYLHGLHPPVFHRDVKPQNLIIRPDGSLALVDFGSAKDPSQTHGTTATGTFGYMPPEQLVGQVDETSDLFALGRTMLELLTRRPPWQALGASELARLPGPLMRVIGQMTATQPSERLPSVAKVRLAIATRGSTARSLTTPRRQKRLGAFVAAGMIVAGGTAFGMVKLMGGAGDPEAGGPAPASLAAPPAEPPVPPKTTVPPEPRAPSEGMPTRPLTLLPETHASSVDFPGRDAPIIAVGGPPIRHETRVWHYEPTPRLWTMLGSAPAGDGDVAVGLEGDRILFVGARATVCTLAIESQSIDCKMVQQPTHARLRPTATRLADGRVLVVGGDRDSSPGHPTAEIYDPEHDRWKLTAAPRRARSGHRAVFLPKQGQVLVVGGDQPEVEVYDDERALWLRVEGESVGVRRFEHTATLVSDGRVLIAGGHRCTGDRVRPKCSKSGAWIYEPDTRKIREVPAPLDPRWKHRAVSVASGVYLIGGENLDETLSTVERFDPETERWSKTSGRRVRLMRTGHIARVIRPHVALIAGGDGKRDTEVDLARLEFIGAGRRASALRRRPRPAGCQTTPGQFGWLTFNSTPYATIFVAGESLGETPISKRKLTAGCHIVRAVTADGREKKVKINIETDKTVRYMIRF